MGQITPPVDSSSIKIGGNVYTHCDLFDPIRNIDATLDLLKIKGASMDVSQNNLEKVFHGYVGAGGFELSRRLKTFSTCKNNEEIPVV